MDIFDGIDMTSPKLGDAEDFKEKLIVCVNGSLKRMIESADTGVITSYAIAFQSIQGERIIAQLGWSGLPCADIDEDPALEEAHQLEHQVEMLEAYGTLIAGIVDKKKRELAIAESMIKKEGEPTQ